MKTSAIVLAAGNGKRMGGAVKKQFIDVCGKPLLYYSLQVFEESFVDEVVLVCSAEDMEYIKNDIVDAYGFSKINSIVPGGKERYDSVLCALEAIKECDFVFIHDGARPMIDSDILKRGLEAVKEYGACVIGMPSKDTVKLSDERGMIGSTPNRNKVWNIQTPQIFRFDTIKNAYETFQKQNNRGVLSQLENKINKKLKSVADKFNKLYFIEDAVYSFKIVLESELIFFSLFRGEQSISLDYQSTGFKWFFNLFFNLLNSTDLNPGDIIIMDEPATSLHVKGQRELRGFLKEFAIHNDISIVIATHSPFLIDLDYLDEIRVVVNKDNITSIENNFAAVNENDPDSLLPIKDSLTVENHILVNPKEKVVFVEGITDYNYLTAFKILFKKEGITFLPINGVGKTKEECIKITQRLMKIRKKDPILLVDNDKAGNCIKEINKDNKDFRIISLSEADENFKTIESLFSDGDKGKFGLVDESGKTVKHASTSTIFKNHILKNQDEVSEKTKNNFKKLFNKLVELAE